MKTNLHTHTYRCQHAEGDVDDYCRAAIDAGLTTLGISDHTALPDDRWANVRMPYAELPNYMAQISAAQQAYPQLRVLRAAECEFDSVYIDYYRSELLGEYGCDYLVGAVHYFKHQGAWLSPFTEMETPGAMASFTDYFTESMACGVFAFMAHPDNFAASRLRFDAEAEAGTRAMCEAAVDLDMIWEINGYGFRKRNVVAESGPRPPYPLKEFWDIAAEYPIRVVVNSDAHRPRDVARNLDDATAVATERGLTIVDADTVLAHGAATCATQAAGA